MLSAIELPESWVYGTPRVFPIITAAAAVAREYEAAILAVSKLRFMSWTPWNYRIDDSRDFPFDLTFLKHRYCTRQEDFRSYGKSNKKMDASLVAQQGAGYADVSVIAGGRY